LTILVFVNFFMQLAFHMASSVVSRYAVSAGATVVAAGWTFTVFSATSLLVRPFGGRLLDRCVMNHPVYLQLFTVREMLARDYGETLRSVAAMGYDGVELFKDCPYSAAELKQRLDDLGLAAISSHYHGGQLDDLSFIERQVEFNACIGAKYFVCAYADFRNTRAADRLAETLRHVAEICEGAGLELAYHNHFQEYIRVKGGYLLEYLLAQVPTMRLELDVYWATVGGADPYEMMTRNRDCLSLVHARQLESYDTKTECDLQDGVIDFRKVIRLAEAYGAPRFVVEADDCPNAEDSARRAVRYLKSL